MLQLLHLRKFLTQLKEEASSRYNHALVPDCLQLLMMLLREKLVVIVDHLPLAQLSNSKIDA